MCKISTISAIFAMVLAAAPATSNAVDNPFSGLMDKLKNLKTNGDTSMSIENALQKIQSGKDADKNAGRLIFSYARHRNSVACNIAGWMFDNGKDVKQDSTKALKWFESCASTNGLAAYNAGVLYAEGRGVVRDNEKSTGFFEQAWKQGIKKPQIAIRLAFYFHSKKSDQEAWTLAQEAASKDSGYGKYIAAKLIIAHASPYEDRSKALEYLNTAMESYIPPAAEMLGWAYGTGYGIDQNMSMAYTMSIISDNMKNQASHHSRWSSGMNEDELRKSEADASRWMQTHKSPGNKLDFSSTAAR